jgi:hypothetical protein
MPEHYHQLKKYPDIFWSDWKIKNGVVFGVLKKGEEEIVVEAKGKTEDILGNYWGKVEELSLK